MSDPNMEAAACKTPTTEKRELGVVCRSHNLGPKGMQA